VNNSLEAVRERLKTSRKVVFFGGAGVSTASGIPDFRSATGLYNQMTGSRYSPETILSYNFFAHHRTSFTLFFAAHFITLTQNQTPRTMCWLKWKKTENSTL